MKVDHLDVVTPRVLEVAPREPAVKDVQSVLHAQLFLDGIDLGFGLHDEPEVFLLASCQDFDLKDCEELMLANLAPRSALATLEHLQSEDVFIECDSRRNVVGLDCDVINAVDVNSGHPGGYLP